MKEFFKNIAPTLFYTTSVLANLAIIFGIGVLLAGG